MYDPAKPMISPEFDEMMALSVRVHFSSSPTTCFVTKIPGSPHASGTAVALGLGYGVRVIGIG
jgi:hypothetical protein